MIVAASVLLIGGLVAGAIWVANNARRSSTVAASPRAVATRANQPLPAALSLGSSDAPVITPDQARQVFDADWTLRERALYDGDVEMVDLIETDVARETDRYLASQIAWGLGGNRKVRPHGDVAFVVPEQASYPARFLASVHTVGYGSGAPQVDLMVFSRTDTTSHWRLALYTGWTGDVLSPSPAPSSGLALPAPETGVDPAAPHRELAAYFQYWKEHLNAPPSTSFLPSDFTVGKGQTIARQAQDAIGSDCNCREHISYSADPRNYAFSVKPTEQSSDGPYPLICGAVRVEIVETPRSSDGRLFQTGDRSNWGPLLAPGYYRQINDTLVRQSCILELQPETWQVIGQTGDTVSMTGTR